MISYPTLIVALFAVAGVGATVSTAASSMAGLARGEAMGAPQLQWTSRGDAPWIIDESGGRNGEPVPRSGLISHNQESVLETNITGPGTLSFWWKVSSEAIHDRLVFAVEGIETEVISGDVDWTKIEAQLERGTQLLSWTYSKDASISQGEDAGWLQEVRFEQSGPPEPPVILEHPQSREVFPFEETTLSVRVAGSPVPEVQWERNGEPIAGANAVALVLDFVGPEDLGEYRARISNENGMALSDAAIVSSAAVDVLYQTDFESYAIGAGALASQGGWRQQNASQAQGIVIDALPQGKAGFVGKNLPDDPNQPAYVWREVMFDPVGEDVPEVTISMNLVVQDSGIGGYDDFHIQIYSSIGELLGGLTFNNASLGISFYNASESTFTGRFFENDKSYRLKITIDFDRNLWAAVLDDELLFPFLPLALPGTKLDLGDLSFGYVVRQPWNPGNNFLAFDHLAVYASEQMSIRPFKAVIEPQELPWTTGGDATWFAQNAVSPDGTYAGQSGRITHDQDTWIETTVSGPGTISFLWKVSSEQYFDLLRFLVNGVERARTSGPQDWHTFSLKLPEGTHTLRWVYSKDGSEDWGWDIAWVGQVEFEPTPEIQSYADWVAEENLIGDEADFTVDLLESGVPNLFRFALGLGSREPARHELPRAVYAENSIGLRFSRAKNRDGIEYILEGSVDLAEWLSLPFFEEVEEIETVPGRQSVHVFPEIDPEDQNRYFLRLRVQMVD